MPTVLSRLNSSNKTVEGLWRLPQTLFLLVLLLCVGEVAAKTVDERLGAAQQLLSTGEYQAAYKKFKRIAKKERHPLAQFTMALFYQQGWARQSRRDKACYWFELAANQQVPAAMHFYASCLAEGIDQPADPAQAVSWYQRAADSGHLISLCDAAELYMQGGALKKDPAKALVLCQQAAQADLPLAQLQTGRYLLEGDEALRNIAAAQQWFELAAQRGVDEAAYYLGVINRDHLGRPQASLYWFEYAAGRGYLPSYYSTATTYFGLLELSENKRPAEKNLAKAYLWLSASVARLRDEKVKAKVEQMLTDVKAVMPESWQPELDQKVAEHLALYPRVVE